MKVAQSIAKSALEGIKGEAKASTESIQSQLGAPASQQPPAGEAGVDINAIKASEQQKLAQLEAELARLREQRKEKENAWRISEEEKLKDKQEQEQQLAAVQSNEVPLAVKVKRGTSELGKRIRKG